MEHPQKKIMQRHALWVSIVAIIVLILATYLCFKGSQYPAGAVQKRALVGNEYSVA
jgi:hypothetical protein